MLIYIFFNQKACFDGTVYGLKLWYSSVIPALLPSMLICSYIINNFKYYSKTKIYILLAFVGVFCGCPIGAKTVSSLLSNNLINKKEANILLCSCNNISLSFISGYIYFVLLNNHISFYIIILTIYLPNILITILRLYLYNKSSSHNTSSSNNLISFDFKHSRNSSLVNL